MCDAISAAFGATARITKSTLLGMFSTTFWITWFPLISSWQIKNNGWWGNLFLLEDEVNGDGHFTSTKGLWTWWLLWMVVSKYSLVPYWHVQKHGKSQEKCQHSQAIWWTVKNGNSRSVSVTCFFTSWISVLFLCVFKYVYISVGYFVGNLQPLDFSFWPFCFSYQSQHENPWLCINWQKHWLKWTHLLVGG